MWAKLNSPLDSLCAAPSFTRPVLASSARFIRHYNCDVPSSHVQPSLVLPRHHSIGDSMQRRTTILALLGLLPGTTTMATAAAPQQVLKHIVMYKFKDDQTPAQVQEVIDAFSKLPGQIDTIIGYEHGTNVSQEMKSEGFTHLFVVTFRDEAGREVYLKHPAHDAYVAIVKGRRDKVIVFDYLTSR